MLLPTCPPTVRKYGWCGVLALVYACGLDMPRTEQGFDELLSRLERVLGKSKPRWRHSKCAKRNLNRGGIGLLDTVAVLEHFCCAHTVDRVKRSGVKMNVNSWLKKVPASSKFIVHTGRHAFFLDVPAMRARWRLYDQSGVKRKQDVKSMKRRGGLLLQKVHAVFTIIAEPSLPALE
mgnify:CR=1 FL=1